MSISTNPQPGGSPQETLSPEASSETAPLETAPPFLAHLPIECRFHFYDILIQEQHTIHILNLASHGPLDALSKTCHQARDEIKTWYRSKESSLLKCPRTGILNPATTVFSLTWTWTATDNPILRAVHARTTKSWNDFCKEPVFQKGAQRFAIDVRVPTFQHSQTEAAPRPVDWLSDTLSWHKFKSAHSVEISYFGVNSETFRPQLRRVDFP